MEAAAQVTVRFVTKLPPQYRVPDDPVVRGGGRDAEESNAKRKHAKKTGGATAVR